MRLIRTLLLACLLPLAAPAPAAEIAAYTEELPPLNYQDGAQVAGFATELLQMVAQQAGFSIDIQILPWARAYRTVLEGPDRLIYSITRTPEREQLFHWVGPISPRQIKLYRLSSRNDIQIQHEADLVRYKSGAMFESAAAKKLAGFGLQPEHGLDLGASDEVTLKKLMLGRTDMVAMLDWAMAWQLKQQNIDPRRVRPVWLLDGGSQYWFALHRDTPLQKVKRLQAALNQISADGRMQKLRQKYLAE
jgi:polar amino acid transport system substrate-binding protein